MVCRAIGKCAEQCDSVSKQRKICVITGSRAEYGLLYWLMKGVSQADDLKLQLVVTGMHLSTEFGLTYKEIEKDNFEIDYKVEMLLSSDSSTGISKSMGVAMFGFADAYELLKPDLVIVLGDRFEIFSAVTAAMIATIPVAHLHGGERTEGAFDEAQRHAITKMSHLHFTSTDEYRKRVIQLGEHPERVFNVGAMGIDNINHLNLLGQSEFEKIIGHKFNKYNLIVTYHPVTLESSTAEEQFLNLLTALDELEETFIIFTKANADTGGKVINKMIDTFVELHSHKAVAHTSLGQLNYLSALQYVDGVIGNSSSGLIEAPSFKIGTLNIGDRQKGRVKCESIIDCSPSYDDIRQGLVTLYSYKFKKNLKGVVNPHGTGGATKKIIDVIRTYSLENILKKAFYDIEVVI